MIEISRHDAFEYFTDIDFKVFDQEFDSLFYQGKALGHDSHNKFFVNQETGQIIMKFYWDEKEVGVLSFLGVIPLEEIKKPVGRPKIGVTKKVSLTLPEEIWDMIEYRKTKLGAKQSESLRMMIEGYFYKDDEEELE